jgi:hypothetical protein
MKNSILILFVLLTGISCTKEVGVPGPAGPQGSAGPSGTGPASDTASIAGQLTLYNEFSLNETDAGGVVVTLTSGTLQLTDTTNTAGLYHFPGMKTGTYNLLYTKPGYDTMKVNGISHFGGGTVPTSVQNVIVTQIPVKTAPISLSLYSNNANATIFTIVLDTSSLNYVQFYLNIELFISTDKNVSSTNYMYEVGFNNPDGNGGYNLSLGKDDPANPTPFQFGDTLYAIVCSYNRYVHITSDPKSDYMDVGDAGCYIDPQTGKLVYPNFSKPSNVLPFVY